MKNYRFQEAVDEPNILLCFVLWLVVWLCDCSFRVLVVSLSLKGPQRPQDGSRISQWRQQRGPHPGRQMHLLHHTNGTSPFPLQSWTTTRQQQRRQRRGSVPPRLHTQRRQQQPPILGGDSPRPTRPGPSTCTAQVRPIVWRATCRLPAHSRRASRLLRWVSISWLLPGKRMYNPNYGRVTFIELATCWTTEVDSRQDRRFFSYCVWTVCKAQQKGTWDSVPGSNTAGARSLCQVLHWFTSTPLLCFHGILTKWGHPFLPQAFVPLMSSLYTSELITALQRAVTVRLKPELSLLMPFWHLSAPTMLSRRSPLCA